VAIASLIGILVRPRRSPEWAWAVGGAAALVAFGILSPAAALPAVARGTDVYLFLGGMLVLAEIAREAGVFDWLAARAIRAAGGSATRLFAIVFAVGIGVTAVLSNDATAVVLTPAVAAAARRARVAPLPHLYACAFVANAGSFILPIANPANLVIFGRAIPQLGAWLAIFALPSVAALGATFAVLRWWGRHDLAGGGATDVAPVALTSAGRVAIGTIGATAIALAVASSRGLPLGAVTAAAGAVAYLGGVVADHRLASAPARASWGVLFLVAGLFVLVAGIDTTGVLASVRGMLASLAHGPAWRAIAAAGLSTAAVSNIANNLPVGLLAGLALETTPHAQSLAAATTIGVDLGPNLAVSGSLASVLWLVTLRREGIDVGPQAFVRVGAIVMPPALLLALAALVLTSR